MIGRDVLNQIKILLRPMQVRIANSIARAVVQLVDDGQKLQRVQISVLAGELVDGAEHFQPYGLYAVPLAGAEAVAMFPNGDRGHALVVAVSDRRYRPTGGQGGETGLYNHMAARVILKANGDIEIQPAPGREVFVRSSGGTAEPVVKRSEFIGHTHGPGTMTAGGDPVLGVTAGAAAVTGTTKLQAE